MSIRQNMHLMIKLSSLPWIRSFALQALIAIAIGQLLLAAWLGGAIEQEIKRTKKFANDAKWITVQVKEDNTSAVHDLVQDEKVSVEDLSTEEVLNKMEPEEPEVVQTVRAMGKEGLQLIPKVVLIRGMLPDEKIDKLRSIPSVTKVEVSPVHHHRLLAFYQHVQIEMRIAMAMITFLLLVMLLGLQRIQLRDLHEVKMNLLTWGSSHFQARLPLFFSLLGMGIVGGTISLMEWVGLQKWMWKGNPFLGELSIDRTLHFPLWTFTVVTIALFIFISLLSFSGKQADE